MILAFGKALPEKIYNRIKHYLSVVLTIDESDNVSGYEIFDSFNKWVVNHRIEWLSRSFEVDMSKKIQSGQGFQIVWYDKALFFVTMSRRDPKGQNSFKTIGVYTIVTAKWNKSKLDKMVQESCTYNEHGQIEIHSSSEKYDYPKYIYDQKQLISSKVYDRMSQTFERFSKGRDYYDDLKIPYKETIMLYGPPGTGKTSLVRHLSAKWNMDLILMESSDLTPTSLARLARRSKQTGIKCVILLEDITSNSSLLKSDNNKKDSFGEIIYNGTLSRFLNTLDGANPLDNVIIVMTTNYIEKLESAIYRDGRVDHRICMEYMNFDEANEHVLEWSKDDPRGEYIKANSYKDALSANMIMKLKNLNKDSKENDRRLSVIVEDNNNFMQLFNNVNITTEEV